MCGATQEDILALRKKNNNKALRGCNGIRHDKILSDKCGDTNVLQVLKYFIGSCNTVCVEGKVVCVSYV